MSRKLTSANTDGRGSSPEFEVLGPNSGDVPRLKFDVYDPELEKLLQNLIKSHGLKTTYTGIEFRNEVVPMGRTKFWQEQRAGRLQTSRSGRSVLITGRQAALYLLAIQREGELSFRNSVQTRTHANKFAAGTVGQNVEAGA